MKIEIRIGNPNLTSKRISYPLTKLDNIELEKERMYNFLMQKECIIENVDNFLLYTLNNGLMSSICGVNDENNELYTIPKFNKDDYEIVCINEDGSETNLQNSEGSIGKNYFNELMACIMNDYYDCLNFYK